MRRISWHRVDGNASILHNKRGREEQQQKNGTQIYILNASLPAVGSILHMQESMF